MDSRMKKIVQHLQEVIKALELHVNNFDTHNIAVMRKAFNEDLSQLKCVITDIEEKEVRLWRRFGVINKETLAEAELLVESKQLSRHDLELLISTFQIKNI